MGFAPDYPTYNVRTFTDELLFSTVRIETDAGVGSACLVEYGVNSVIETFLVTNKHVIGDAQRGEFFFFQGRGGHPILGPKHHYLMGEFSERFHGHPDPEVDVTITPITRDIAFTASRGHEIYIRPIKQALFGLDEKLMELDAIESLVFIGYPSGIYDEKNGLPLVRRAVTATVASVDFNGAPVFLIDGSVFRGSSGSPVFVAEGGYTSVLPRRLVFVGIIASSHVVNDTSAVEWAPIPTSLRAVVRVEQFLDLGIVFKARAVAEAIESYFALPARDRLVDKWIPKLDGV